METNSLDRLKKRKKIKNSYTVSNNVNEALVNELLNSSLDTKRIDDTFNKVETFYDTSVSDDEAKEFLEKFKKDFNQDRFDKLIIDCKKEVINSIVTPFGLGKVVAAYDKAGGNVTTLHNFEQGVTATDDDMSRYSEWKDSNKNYNRKPYDKAIVKDKNGKILNGDFNKNKKKTIFNDMQSGQKVVDGYTEKELGTKQGTNIDKNTEIDLEHITSAKEIETDSKNHLFARGSSKESRQNDRVKVATNDSNLTLINGGMNSSKNDNDLMKWANSPISKQHAKEVGNPNMTNAEYYELNPNLIEKEYNKSKEFIKKEQLVKQIEKQSKEVAITGLNEGAKMGLQQALGLVIVEFFTAVFDEVIDIYKNGYSANFDDDSFLNVLKERLKRIGIRIKDKWKDVAIAFRDGFISGFISNLVTTFINVFVTTGKRVVRMIREGFFSLFKAVKILLFPPEGLTYAEALHEAKKILATGVIVGLGVIIEQYIDGLIKASVVLEPLSDIITTVFMGAITGISVTMAVYYIDKKKNDKDAIKQLMENTQETNKNIDKLLNPTLQL
ncbi:hypothetical protein [Aliarcobacter cryaerophilus]|uniref:hypothetical protein n=1 Tax=Aliarcobacter cryaerophilus TaxID=28198 RepID=UPI00082527A2|nr:hypothetical protein [Aliarcobacter cryaerophilus]